MTPEEEEEEEEEEEGISSKDILLQNSGLGGTIFRGNLYAYYLLKYSIPLRRKVSFLSMIGTI